MKVKATKSGSFPSGCHWVAGEVRDLDFEKKEIPSWLVEVKAPKKPTAKKGAPAESEE
ncbi:MAG: hypothetical protein GOVbin1773_32 [Prokaryotic dsDNA virus sp.]|jgi:hypothetical protein|nr:MAG: hypothetical protein GOVbin1773_32 [Prokaryotic dsDNA virus sp.]